MIISQLLASGGLWFNFDGTQILMDPGPGCIVQVNKRKLNPQELSAIIVSHRHLDHSADLNVMTEAMTDGGFRKHGIIFTPRDAIESDSIASRGVKIIPCFLNPPSVIASIITLTSAEWSRCRWETIIALSSWGFSLRLLTCTMQPGPGSINICVPSKLNQSPPEASS